MTTWKERLLQYIPLWATLFMIGVMVFVDVVLLARLHFLISAVPILIVIVIAVVIAIVRNHHHLKEGPVA